MQTIPASTTTVNPSTKQFKKSKKYSTLKVVTILDRDDMELHRTATQEASDAVLLRPVDEINVLKRVREQLSNAALAVN